MHKRPNTPAETPMISMIPFHRHTPPHLPPMPHRPPPTHAHSPLPWLSDHSTQPETPTPVTTMLIRPCQHYPQHSPDDQVPAAHTLVSRNVRRATTDRNGVTTIACALTHKQRSITNKCPQQCPTDTIGAHDPRATHSQRSTNRSQRSTNRNRRR